MVPVPRQSDYETAVERRVAAHLREQMVRRKIGTSAIARRLEVHKSYVSRLLNEIWGADAAFVARMHAKLGVSADVLLDEDPPQQFFKIGPPPIPDRDEEPQSPSSSASRSVAHPGKRGTGGGQH